MSFINSLSVKLFAKHIGTDKFGNKYYIGKGKNYLGQHKRFVIYKGQADGSKVPPMWHAWLHYLSADVPTNDIQSYYWQAEHVPNVTGTKHAYHPAHAKNTKIDTYSKWIPTK